MATAEFAMALPALVVVLTLVVGMAQLLLTHHRAWHAASVAARLAARGESDGAVREAVRTTGLPGAVLVTRGGGWVTTTVEADTPLPLQWALPDLSARVMAVDEGALADGVDDGGGDSADDGIDHGVGGGNPVASRDGSAVSPAAGRHSTEGR